MAPRSSSAVFCGRIADGGDRIADITVEMLW